MVNTRRKNAKADVNPSKPVFSKERNDLKIQQVHEYYPNATGRYSLNKFVIGLNESSNRGRYEKSLTFHDSLKVFWLNMQLHNWVSLMIICILIQITKALGEMLLLHFFCTLPNV